MIVVNLVYFSLEYIRAVRCVESVVTHDTSFIRPHLVPGSRPLVRSSYDSRLGCWGGRVVEACALRFPFTDVLSTVYAVCLVCVLVLYGERPVLRNVNLASRLEIVFYCPSPPSPAKFITSSILVFLTLSPQIQPISEFLVYCFFNVTRVHISR